MEIKSEGAPSQAAVSYSEDYQEQDPAYYDTPHHPGEENTYQPLDTSQGETPTAPPMLPIPASFAIKTHLNARKKLPIPTKNILCLSVRCVVMT